MLAGQVAIESGCRALSDFAREPCDRFVFAYQFRQLSARHKIADTRPRRQPGLRCGHRAATVGRQQRLRRYRLMHRGEQRREEAIGALGESLPAERKRFEDARREQAAVSQMAQGVHQQAGGLLHQMAVPVIGPRNGLPAGRGPVRSLDEHPEMCLDHGREEGREGRFTDDVDRLCPVVIRRDPEGELDVPRRRSHVMYLAREYEPHLLDRISAVHRAEQLDEAHPFALGGLLAPAVAGRPILDRPLNLAHLAKEQQRPLLAEALELPGYLVRHTRVAISEREGDDRLAIREHDRVHGGGVHVVADREVLIARVDLRDVRDRIDGLEPDAEAADCDEIVFLRAFDDPAHGAHIVGRERQPEMGEADGAVR